MLKNTIVWHRDDTSKGQKFSDAVFSVRLRLIFSLQIDRNLLKEYYALMYSILKALISLTFLTRIQEIFSLSSNNLCKLLENILSMFFSCNRFCQHKPLTNLTCLSTDFRNNTFFCLNKSFTLTNLFCLANLILIWNTNFSL